MVMALLENSIFPTVSGTTESGRKSLRCGIHPLPPWQARCNDMHSATVSGVDRIGTTLLQRPLTVWWI